MKIQNYNEVEGFDAAPGVVMRIVAGSDEGAPNFVMRHFEVQPESSTPVHEHPWEHEVFVIAGKGVMKGAEKESPLKEGDAVMVLPGELHGFINAGNDPLRLICVVPLVDGKMPGMPEND
jgi:quercetin dioxygenase-like cupin family protein